MIGSPSQYAKHRGVSAAAVSKALDSGRIVPCAKKGKRVLLDFDECDQMWNRNTDRSKPSSTVVDVEAVEVPDRERLGQRPIIDLDPDDKSMTFNEARTKRERYNAELARLEFERLAGKLVDVDEVRAEQFKNARNVRDSLLNIPDRIAPSLVGLSSLHEVRTILTQEIHRVCTDLAND